MALSALQERVAALVAGLPESAAFVLAGGAAMAVHDMLDRTTRDLDYFAGPDDAAAVQRFADAFEDAAKAGGLEELGADKVLAIFGRAEPRDFVDLAELTRRVPFDELLALASAKDPGLDLAVLDQFMERVQAMRPGALGLDAESYRALVEQVQRWRAHIRQLLARERGTGRPGPGHGLEL